MAGAFALADLRRPSPLPQPAQEIARCNGNISREHDQRGGHGCEMAAHPLARLGNFIALADIDGGIRLRLHYGRVEMTRALFEAG